MSVSTMIGAYREGAAGLFFAITPSPALPPSEFRTIERGSIGQSSTTNVTAAFAFRAWRSVSVVALFGLWYCRVSLTPMTESQDRALYQMGEEAVVTFFLDISRRLQAMEEQAAKNSGNSSKPPSHDGLRKSTLKPTPQSLRKKNGRKLGGQ